MITTLLLTTTMMTEILCSMNNGAQVTIYNSESVSEMQVSNFPYKLNDKPLKIQKFDMKKGHNLIQLNVSTGLENLKITLDETQGPSSLEGLVDGVYEYGYYYDIEHKSDYRTEKGEIWCSLR